MGRAAQGQRAIALERGGDGRVPCVWRRGGGTFGTSRATASSSVTGATRRRTCRATGSPRFPRESGSARGGGTACGRARGGRTTPGMCALCLVPGGYPDARAAAQPVATEWGSTARTRTCAAPGTLPEVIVTPSTTCAPVADMHRVKNSRMTLECGLCGLSGGCAVLDEELLPGLPRAVRARGAPRGAVPGPEDNLAGGVLLRRTQRAGVRSAG